MIGFLINETIELAYTLVKYTYLGGKYVYFWYYPVESDHDKIVKLTKRIEDLERSK